MDKKYNGFNNGRDKSDGVGGREVNHGTQETMTKEQILPTVSQMDAAIDTIITKMYGGLEAASIEHFLQTGKVNGSFRERLYDCIKTTFMLVDIKQKTEHLKQLSAERERYDKIYSEFEEVCRQVQINKDMCGRYKEAYHKEFERSGKLVEALRKTMRVIEDYEGELSLGYISANQTLNEYDTATKES